jgi:predicted nucleic acid-binding protein
VEKEPGAFYPMKIVIDTNIIFSALVNSNSAIAEIIIGSSKNYQFYASEYTWIELLNHHEKLKKASKLSDEKIDTAKQELFKHIHFVTLEIIPENCWIRAEQLVIDIDPDDIAFVALSLYLQAYLWTGDKVLYNGLKGKDYYKIISTSELKARENNFGTFL